MMRVMSKMTATATKSISLKPLGRDGTVRRHLVEEIPIVVPRYVVKPLVTVSLESTDQR